MYRMCKLTGTSVEIRRIAFDANFDVFGLNLAVEELRGYVGR